MRERRKYVRLDASIKVRYRVLKGAEARRETLSKNISGGGVRFPVKEGLKEGAVLELEIEIPNGSGSIEAIGQVVWLEKIPTHEEAKKEYFDIGTKFIRIDPFDRERILGYVYGRIHKLVYNEVGRTVKEIKGKQKPGA